MKMKFFAALAVLTLCSAFSFAQDPKLPKKVRNVTILDLNGNSAMLPNFGKKNLLIFYVDPEKHKQNEAFTIEMENNHKVEGENLYGFGIINAADAWYPNRIIRAIARKRTAKNGATILTDQDRILRYAWGLGDCNDAFVLMIVSKEGELVYCKKGELSRQEIEEFYKFVEPYR